MLQSLYYFISTLVSSAADNTIKMWDVSAMPKKPCHTIKVQEFESVWKVKYTPFGEGLVRNF